jgi:hypothetical protein
VVRRGTGSTWHGAGGTARPPPRQCMVVLATPDTYMPMTCESVGPGSATRDDNCSMVSTLGAGYRVARSRNSSANDICGSRSPAPVIKVFRTEPPHHSRSLEMVCNLQGQTPYPLLQNIYL